MANLLLLGGLPERADARAWEPILSILHGDSSETDLADAEATIKAKIDALSPIWAATLKAREVLRASEEDDELDDAQAAAVADSLAGLLGDDAFVLERADEVRDGDLRSEE